MKILKPVTSDKWQVTRTGLSGKSLVTRHSPLVTCRAFTMVEIAISLAVIGIALVAIIGVLPLGMNVQRDNREATVVNQDATFFIEAIRSGAHGMDDLTNYVYAITNYWTEYDANGNFVKANNDGYSYQGSQITRITTPPFFPITNGLRIIGLLSTPGFTDGLGVSIPSLNFGGYSNHVVAYVHSLSGPAVEKPPQDNDILRGDSFGYRIISENVPVAVDTNLFYLQPFWQALPYASGVPVFYNWSYWRSIAPTLATDVPGQSSVWAKTPLYSLELAANLHELRLSFLWPTQPNGAVGPGRQTFRLLVAGQIAQTNYNNSGQMLYFFQSQSFTNAP
jgi:prepilin-type N-terminal cleavage/methylation domain-containing protein